MVSYLPADLIPYHTEPEGNGMVKNVIMDVVTTVLHNGRDQGNISDHTRTTPSAGVYMTFPCGYLACAHRGY
jgi:hypothetical protein